MSIGITEFEDAFCSAMWDAISKTAEKYGYYTGGGSHMKISDGKRHFDFGFIATPSKKSIPKDKLIGEHRQKVRMWSKKTKAKWAKVPMRKIYEWDGQTLKAGHVYKSWTENEQNAETIKIIGFRKDRIFKDIHVYYEILSQPAHPVTYSLLEGHEWVRRFKLVK